jgi:hypothetical protein
MIRLFVASLFLVSLSGCYDEQSAHCAEPGLYSSTFTVDHYSGTLCIELGVELGAFDGGNFAFDTTVCSTRFIDNTEYSQLLDANVTIYGSLTPQHGQLAGKIGMRCARGSATCLVSGTMVYSPID